MELGEIKFNCPDSESAALVKRVKKPYLCILPDGLTHVNTGHIKTIISVEVQPDDRISTGNTKWRMKNPDCQPSRRRPPLYPPKG